jgi:hypothetical protein
MRWHGLEVAAPLGRDNNFRNLAVSIRRRAYCAHGNRGTKTRKARWKLLGQTF